MDAAVDSRIARTTDLYHDLVVMTPDRHPMAMLAMAVRISIAYAYTDPHVCHRLGGNECSTQCCSREGRNQYSLHCIAPVQSLLAPREQCRVDGHGSEPIPGLNFTVLYMPARGTALR